MVYPLNLQNIILITLRIMKPISVAGTVEDARNVSGAKNVGIVNWRLVSLIRMMTELKK